MTDNMTYVGEIQRDQRNKGAKQNRHFKAEARRALFASDNFYKAVISHLICGAMCGGFLYITYYTPDLFDMYFSALIGEKAAGLLTNTFNAVMYALFALVFMVFFAGVYTLAARMRETPDSEPGAVGYSSLSAMLDPISGFRNFRRTIVITLILTVELAVVAAPAVVVFIFADGTGMNGTLLFLLKAATVIPTAFICLFFIFLLVPMPYVTENDPGIGAFAAYKKSASAALCGIWRCYGLLFSFIPLILLSALTFGVLYFAYTVPYMTLSYAKAGEYLYTIANTERNEENE